MKAPTQESIDSAITHAEEAFWEKIGVWFPECKSGDFPPDAQARFSRAMNEAVTTWLNCNHPSKQ